MPAAGSALAGIRVVEVGAKGPAPFAVMLLADLGAEVIRVDRAAADHAAEMRSQAGTGRGRRSIALDLKADDGCAVLLRLLDTADVVVEGFRPGVAERLGFGPDVCLGRNPRLVYGRMTGWGQDGPLAARAGHDINYLAIAGALFPLGSADRPPPPPLNLVGDFGGGALYLVIGILAALVERERSGHGQVIDAAMVDGVASMLTAYHALHDERAWQDQREANLVDGAAPCYRAYETADHQFVAVGCLEPSMYRELLARLGLDPAEWPQFDIGRWPAQRTAFAERFASQPRSHWEELFAGSDACVSPVLSLDESRGNAHLVARGTFRDGSPLPAAAPRLSRTPTRAGAPSPFPGTHTDEILAELGLSSTDQAALRASGAVA